MNNKLSSNHAAGPLLSAVVMLAALIGPAVAEDQPAPAPDPSFLRICAAEKEEPYSNTERTGFENKIAETLAKAMGRKPDFVWLDKPAIYLVRDALDKNLCDVVIGLDTGDERVLTSKPYYRAPYIFIMRKDSPLDITSWDSPDVRKAKRVGLDADTPAQVMLEKLGIFNGNFNYMKSLTGFKSKRNQYVRIDPRRFVEDVVAGKADFAVVFAPEVARYAKERGDAVKVVVVPDTATRSDGQHLPFHFDQSIGVRKDDPKLLEEINAALEKARPEIESILVNEGIPLEDITKTPGGNAG